MIVEFSDLSASILFLRDKSVHIIYNHRMFQRIAMVARWRPVHNGHVPVLRALCQNTEQAIIGIGSANRYNLRNPFTLEETIDMLELALEGFDNYTLLPIPDLDDGPRWREMVKGLLGTLDLFVTDNPYVFSLLKEDYRVERPVTLVPLNERLPLDGTTVRRVMARGEDWQRLVPPAVANYMTDRQLDVRFRREFGLQTLSQAVHSTPHIIS
jgi:nicotinamide-nucleotide adenylyltransferase